MYVYMYVCITIASRGIVGAAIVPSEVAILTQKLGKINYLKPKPESDSARGRREREGGRDRKEGRREGRKEGNMEGMEGDELHREQHLIVRLLVVSSS